MLVLVAWLPAYKYNINSMVSLYFSTNGLVPAYEQSLLALALPAELSKLELCSPSQSFKT